MLPTIKSIAALLLSYGLLLMANGLSATLLGIRSTIEGFSPEITGFVMASYFLGLFIGARYAVWVVARVGHIRSFAAFASVMSVSALTHAIFIEPLAWMFMRMASGFCMAGMIMVTESWLNERATNVTRGRVLSIYMITNYAAAGSAQLLLNVSDPAKFHLFSLASILFSVALIPVLLTRAVAPQPVSIDRMSLRELYRISPLGMLGALCAGLINATFYGLAPVFGREIGLQLSDISIFMATIILAGLLLQWPMGWLSDRIDRRWILTIVTLLTCVACLLIVYASRGESWLLYAAGILYGSLSFTIYSLSAAHANDFAGSERLIQVAGGLLVTYGIGAILGPIIGSVVMGQIGPAGLFWFSASVTALLGLFSLWRMSKRAAKRRWEKRRFVPVPSTQYTSDELYQAAQDQQEQMSVRASDSENDASESQ